MKPETPNLNDILIDFLVFLNKRGTIDAARMPSDTTELLNQYWATYQ